MTSPAFLALGLAALLCPFTHPYDIIWHWSSCHPSPPCLLPLPSSCPPFPLLPARDGSSERRREPSPLLFFSAQAQTAAPRQSAGSSIFLCECFLTYHLRSQSLLFTFRVFFPPLFSPPPHPLLLLLFLFAALCVSLILFLSPSSISIYEQVLMGL